MELKTLKKRQDTGQNEKLGRAFTQFEKLLSELGKKELPDGVTRSINDGVERINAASQGDAELLKQLKKTQSGILKLLEKELKLVPKNHYRNSWMAIGMAVFGIPLGVAFGTSLGNMAFLGIGLPIGMAIGMGVGTSMDKKAFAEGRQLDLDLNLN